MRGWRPRRWRFRCPRPGPRGPRQPGRRAAGAKGSFFLAPEAEGGWAPLLTFPLPFTRTELYNTDGGIRWVDTFLQTGAGGPSDDLVTETYGSPVSYRAGGRYDVSWNGAVFGPSLPTGEVPRSGVIRAGDLLIVELPMYGDRAGREGFTASRTGRTVLYRNGVLIGESGEAGRGVFQLPPEPAEYRLEVTADNDPRLSLSRSVTATWVFHSEHAGDDGGGGKGKGRGLPQALSTVRFLPTLDEENAIRAGRGSVMPIEVDHQGGSSAGGIRDLEVEVSYDDGGSWRPVHAVLLPRGNGRAVMPPARPGYVSLRARATDGTGNTVEVTVIRAYRVD